MTPAADAEPASSRLTRPASHAAGPDADDPLSPAGSSAADARSLRVSLLLETADTDPPAAGWIEPLLDRAIDLLDLPHPKTHHHALTLVLVDDERMAALHHQYTGVPGTTDVLTFDHRDTQQQPLHADIILGRDVAQRQADARPHDARTELLLYAVHGLLHLVGEDDHDPHAYQQMHQREDQLLQQLGLSPAFHAEIKNQTSAVTPPKGAHP